jgi:hypothetical protein
MHVSRIPLATAFSDAFLLLSLCSLVALLVVSYGRSTADK